MSNEENDYQEMVPMFNWVMYCYEELYQKFCSGQPLEDVEIDHMEVLLVAAFSTAQVLMRGRSLASAADQEIWQHMESIHSIFVSNSEMDQNKSIVLFVLVKCYEYLEKFHYQIINK